jgi:uncharacterized membrane protein
MTENNSAVDEAAAFFSARLTPYRSLGPRGFLVLMTFVSGLCFAAGLAFWAIGAWPIVGFMGLDVAIVWLAFRASYRQARAFEEIRLSPAELVIRRVSASGDATEVRLNPYWARLVVDRLEDEGVVRLAVASHGRAHEIGGFLDPAGRESFGRAFGAALAAARAGSPG